MYAKASPLSLALAMFVRDQVLSLLSYLKFLKKKGQNQDEATASSCLTLATALGWSLGGIPNHFRKTGANIITMDFL